MLRWCLLISEYTNTFSFPFSGIVTSVLRFIEFYVHDALTDVTFSAINILTWTCIEPGVYFIAATLPSLQPLVRFLLQKATFYHWKACKIGIASKNLVSFGRSGQTISQTEAKVISVRSEESSGHHSAGESDTKANADKEDMMQLGKISNDEREQKTGVGCKIRAESAPDEDIV